MKLDIKPAAKVKLHNVTNDQNYEIFTNLNREYGVWFLYIDSVVKNYISGQYTQRSLAMACGVSASNINKWLQHTIIVYQGKEFTPKQFRVIHNINGLNLI